MVKSRSVKINAKNAPGLGRDRAVEPVRIFLKACSSISAPDIPSNWSIVTVNIITYWRGHQFVITKMANANRACDLDKFALSCALDECLLNLARGKDVVAIMPTGFGKSLIFQLFPRLAKAALTLENSTIIVVSPLISIMRDQVEQLKKLGFSAAAIWHR